MLFNKTFYIKNVKRDRRQNELSGILNNKIFCNIVRVETFLFQFQYFYLNKRRSMIAERNIEISNEENWNIDPEGIIPASEIDDIYPSYLWIRVL